MSDASGTGCRRNAWAVAAAGGALVALMLMFVAKFAFLKALVIGAVLALALGLILVWAFCSQTEESRAATVAAPAPKPEPAATERKPEAVEPQAEPRTVAARPVPAAKPVAAKGAAVGLDAALAKSKDDTGRGSPELLPAPRGGKPDDLKLIKGIGPALERLLNEVGVWHFDQIASWRARDIAFVDSKIVGFHGRITRDEWVKQAKVLAKGGKTELSERVSKSDAG